MAYLRKHPKSPFWSAWFTDENGERTSRSTKLRDRREALKLAINWEEDAKAAREGLLPASQALKVYNKMLGKSGQKVTAETLEGFAAGWLRGKQSARAERTAGTYGPIVAAFLATLGTRVKAPITAIGHADIEKHRELLTKQSLKPSTIRQSLKVIGSMFAAALRQGLIEANPVRAIEFDETLQAEREPFTADEIKALLAHASSEWKTTILLGAHAGLRLGDAVSLRWDSIDLAGKLLKFKPEKTRRKGREVIVPMTAALYDHLMSIAGDSTGLVSPSLAEVGSGGRSGLSGQFKALMETAGIENRVVAEGKGQGRTQSAKSFHSLRHSFNSALTNAGVDEKIRMELSGHSTASVNRRYSHVSPEVRREAIDKMQQPSK